MIYTDKNHKDVGIRQVLKGSKKALGELAHHQFRFNKRIPPRVSLELFFGQK